MPQKREKRQGMTNNVGLTFRVDDTIPRITISIEAKQLELVTLNIIFSAVSMHTEEYYVTSLR